MSKKERISPFAIYDLTPSGHLKMNFNSEETKQMIRRHLRALGQIELRNGLIVQNKTRQSSF